MTQALVNKLCCPFDKQQLNLQTFVKDVDDNIIEGLLTCSHCHRYYPIAYGVPIMTPDEYREKPLEIPLLKRWEADLKDSSPDGFRMLRIG